MNLPDYITTKEAMALCRAKSYEKFTEIRKELSVNPVWRCGEGNIYRRDDFIKNNSPDQGGFANV